MGINNFLLLLFGAISATNLGDKCDEKMAIANDIQGSCNGAAAYCVTIEIPKGWYNAK